MMGPRQTNSRRYQRQAIDAEIKLLKESFRESFRVLRLRRNTLAPISSLSTEVIAAIFSLLHLSQVDLSPLVGGKPDILAWLRVSHVCHQWRDIALNNTLFWSHIDFNRISSAGAAETLARAKKAPLHLTACTTGDQRDDARFTAVKKALQSHVSYVCHLSISANSFFLRRTLKRLASPAPTLEYLSLSTYPNSLLRTTPQATVPDALFDGTTPRLSRLNLYKCNISWKSPLLKGLTYLEISEPSKRVRPSLANWLDALGEMPQLKELILHSASPIAPPFPFDIERTVTLPFLTLLNISASVGDCALALSHLVLPALTRLSIKAQSILPDGGDVIKFLPYAVQHAHGPQDKQLLQSVLIRSQGKGVEILAWPDFEVGFDTLHLLRLDPTRVELFIWNRDWFTDTYIQAIDAAIAALPLENLVMLDVGERTRLDEEFWRHHAPRWPMLQCVQLAPPAARGFRDMMLQDNGGRECPLLPSLTVLSLVESALSARRTHLLCDLLRKRVEKGVPIKTPDLYTCRATGHAVELLDEIVANVCLPEPPDLEPSCSFSFVCDDDDSEAEDYSSSDDDEIYASDGSEEGDEGEISDEDEEGENYSEMED
ncbi:hypothetical protein EI94DRAFT_1730642 [Lactarius quietus]|nr:hypothetical protein EI94DRAFT_1730642 [Lactarius quietus]